MTIKIKHDMSTTFTIIIIVLGLFAFMWMGIALHLARTVAQMHDYLKQLEKDYIEATQKILDYESRN